jgi:hypothetical protein
MQQGSNYNKWKYLNIERTYIITGNKIIVTFFSKIVKYMFFFQLNGLLSFNYYVVYVDHHIDSVKM